MRWMDWFSGRIGLCVSAALMAVLATKKSGYSKGGRGWQPLNKHLSALSYGVFLYHFPVIWLLNITLPTANPVDILNTLALTITAAAIGHWLLERPLWRLFR